MLIVTHEMDFAREVSNRVFFMKDGLIHEEGTPAQIFDNPQRSETRVFTQRVRKLALPLNNVAVDLYAMQGEIVRFCQKHRLTTAIQFNLTVILEEVYQIIKPTLTEGAHFSVTIEYSEKKRLTQFVVAMPLDYEGELLSLVGDSAAYQVVDLGVTLVSGMVMNVDLESDSSEKRLTLGLGQS